MQHLHAFFHSFSVHSSLAKTPWTCTSRRKFFQRDSVREALLALGKPRIHLAGGACPACPGCFALRQTMKFLHRVQPDVVSIRSEEPTWRLRCGVVDLFKSVVAQPPSPTCIKHDLTSDSEAAKSLWLDGQSRHSTFWGHQLHPTANALWRHSIVQHRQQDCSCASYLYKHTNVTVHW